MVTTSERLYFYLRGPKIAREGLEYSPRAEPLGRIEANLRSLALFLRISSEAR